MRWIVINIVFDLAFFIFDVGVGTHDWIVGLWPFAIFMWLNAMAMAFFLGKTVGWLIEDRQQ